LSSLLPTKAQLGRLVDYLDRQVRQRDDRKTPTIIGTCINCIAPGSFSATLALIFDRGGCRDVFRAPEIGRS